MSKSDQWVNIILVTFILLYVSAWVFGYRTNKLSPVITFLNLASALGLVIYWIAGEIKITQHIIELREIIVFGFEVLLIGCAIYNIVSGYRFNWLKIIQQIFFWAHLIVLILGLTFMLTFKMNKLI